MKKIILIISLLVLCMSCYESEKFSSNSDLMIKLEETEVAFDTVFSSIVSPLKQIKIYNTNNNSLSFSRISLSGKENSLFRMNINGRAGYVVENVELLRKDSIYLFLDVNTSNPQGNSLNSITDELVLEWNGNEQRIPLSAVLKKVRVFEKYQVKEDMILTEDVYLKDTLRVDENRTLTIEPGVIIYSGKNGAIDVYGTLVAQGTIDSPVVFRGSGMNKASSGILFDNMPNQWQGINIRKTSYNNMLQYVNIKNSKYGIDMETAEANRSKLVIESSIIHNTSSFGIKAINSNISIFNSQITNSGGALISVTGGRLNMIHSTIANYYQWDTRSSSAFVLTDRKDTSIYPLLGCSIVNTIIVGLKKQELNIGEDINPVGPLYFGNCVLQVTNIPNNLSPFHACKWNIDTPFVFRNVNSRKDYAYDFQLPIDAESVAIGNADFSYSSLFPYDLKGRSRIEHGVSDIGCYEHSR